ncbi:MAG: hypothetical protein HZA17_08765 [Nitrospirae bacterium]|nr:hypothetical protein [Nitrospirota bacterium]
MGLKGLAEGIILQSIEDLWNENHRDDCVAFFKGEDFLTCSKIAGMSLHDQVRLLNLVRDVIEREKKASGKVTRPVKQRMKRHHKLQGEAAVSFR